MTSMQSRLESFRSAFLERRHFSSLDGLRALSIVPVVWHHSTPRPLEGALGKGPIGVDLFFAISGFLITTLLLRERRRRGRIDLSAFYARRSLRIFPLYYLVLGLHLFFALLLRPDWEPSRRFLAQAPWYATYTANWGAPFGPEGPALFVFAWSLCTEEQFYGFWAPALRYCRSLIAAAGLMVAWLLVDLWLESGYWGSSGMRQTIPYVVLTSFASPIGLGAIAALAIHDDRFGPWLMRLMGHRHSATIVFGVVLWLVLRPWAGPPVLHLLLALLVLSCSVRRDHGLVPFLDNAAARFVGKISYGIYLLHVPVIGLVRLLAPRLREDSLAVFTIAFPATLILATVSFEFFERRFLELGVRFRRE